MKKYFLTLVMIVLSSSLIACNDETKDTTTISVERFEKSIAKEATQILDVRSMEEYQSGHIKGALLADWTNLNEFVYRTQSLDKSKPVYAYCFSGARSLKAAMFLKGKGFVVYNLDGGIAAWKSEGKAVEGVSDAKQISLSEYRSLIPVDKIVLVDISAAWCPPCKKMEPIVDSLAALQSAKFSLVKIDGAAQNVIVQSLNITVFPTFVIYKNGKEFWRKEGIVGIDELSKQLQ